ncbi:MAG: hypothetical protein V4597_08450 [Pseudomonadota bacterium]
MTPQAVELVAALAEAKAHVRTAAAEAVDKLRARTGLSPAAIYVRMVETTAAGAGIRQHIVGEVEIDLGRL